MLQLGFEELWRRSLDNLPARVAMSTLPRTSDARFFSRDTEAPRFSKESVTNVLLQGLVLQLLLIVCKRGHRKEFSRLTPV
jgi:hypothetical protein